MVEVSAVYKVSSVLVQLYDLDFVQSVFNVRAEGDTKVALSVAEIDGV